MFPFLNVFLFFGASSTVAAAAAAAAAATATATRELEAQTTRRAARQAERERGVKERARKAADNLGSGGWKEFTLEDSAKYARKYKLGIAKKVRRGRRRSPGHNPYQYT